MFHHLTESQWTYLHLCSTLLWIFMLSRMLLPFYVLFTNFIGFCTPYKLSIYGPSTNSSYRNVENTSNIHENGRLRMLDKDPSYWVPAHRIPIGKVEIENIEKLASTYNPLKGNAYHETIPSTPHMPLETNPSVMAKFQY